MNLRKGAGRGRDSEWLDKRNGRSAPESASVCLPALKHAIGCEPGRERARRGFVRSERLCRPPSRVDAFEADVQVRWLSFPIKENLGRPADAGQEVNMQMVDWFRMRLWSLDVSEAVVERE